MRDKYVSEWESGQNYRQLLCRYSFSGQINVECPFFYLECPCRLMSAALSTTVFWPGERDAGCHRDELFSSQSLLVASGTLVEAQSLLMTCMYRNEMVGKRP